MTLMGLTPGSMYGIPAIIWDEISRERVAEVYGWDLDEGNLPPAAVSQAARLGLNQFLETPYWLK